MHRKLCIAIIGPTASGKSQFAVEAALKLGGEIVCVDSTTVYQGFDIGTGKPTPEQRQAVPHHLLDILEPEASFSAFDFVAKARAVIEEISSRGKLPILVGGSYFYLRALQNGMYPTGAYDDDALDKITAQFTEDDTLNGEKLHAALAAADPKTAQAIHPNDSYRLLRAMALVSSGILPSQQKPAHALGPEYLWVKYAMAVSRKTLMDNINQRIQNMLRAGLVDETRRMLASHPKSKALGSIGYAETQTFLRGEISETDLAQQISENTRQLLKRQVTWLRSDPEVRFIDSRDLARVELEIANLKAVLS
jgi:tRNA dimethylallyltransferase